MVLTDATTYTQGTMLPLTMKGRFALSLLLITACAHKFADLKKVEPTQRFTLARDYTRMETRGLGYKWVEGLRAGTYILAAEDDEGLYFKGDGGCVVRMSEAAADEYLRTGQSKVHFAPGGLWVPKKGITAGARIFYEFTTDPSMYTNGALGGAAAEAAKGDVLFIPFESERAFLASLQISGN